MTSDKWRLLKIDLIKIIILGWVEQGMTLEEAKQQWLELEEYHNAQ